MDLHILDNSYKKNHTICGLLDLLSFTYGFPGDSEVKNISASSGDLGSISGLGRSPEEGSILAWEIPWTEEPGKLYPMGLQKSQTRLSD